MNLESRNHFHARGEGAFEVGECVLHPFLHSSVNAQPERVSVQCFYGTFSPSIVSIRSTNSVFENKQAYNDSERRRDHLGYEETGQARQGQVQRSTAPGL